jgi:allantoate deiminase
MADFLAAAQQVINRCRTLAQFTEEPGWTTRTYLSPPMHDVHASVKGWMQATGMHVSIDAVGNIRGVYPGLDPRAPRLVIGSHLDTVPHAGAFDGILGVMLGLALIEAQQHEPLPATVEIIGFSEEEGVRYGVPFIGSRAITGTLDDALIERISDAVQTYGLDESQIPDAALKCEVAGYLETHIEQGPVLASLGLPLAVVEAIAGQSRFIVEFAGHANHAGTTPMHFRRDALAAAAEWILMVERIAIEVPGLVATVGSLAVEPGASNVIAGIARCTLDVRHASDAIRENAVARILRAAKNIADRRQIGVQHEVRLEQKAALMDPGISALLSRAVEAAGLPLHQMVSGAGHDAMIIARSWPAAMLFLRSPGGISHHPDETVLCEDVAAALAAGFCFLDHWKVNHA